MNGILLGEKGFKNIFGIDASENFLDNLKNIPSYTESRNMFLGKGVDKFPDELKNRFDIVVGAGVWIKSHIPAEGMEDVFAALKVGGYFVSATRALYWVKGQEQGYKDMIDKYIS